MTTVKHLGTDRTYTTYIKCARALKALGIEWCGTSEWIDGYFVDPTKRLYGD